MLRSSARCEARHSAQSIAVCMVNPGPVQTPIWAKSTGQADQLLAAAPPQAAALYGRLIQQARASRARSNLTR